VRIIAVNGSPRKKWNTATLLEHALLGAQAEGATTELVHLYDLRYHGCLSCFACKLKTGKSYGACAAGDDLKPVLARIASADALILGSPIYYGNLSGQMRSFLERLLFQYLVYDRSYSSLRPHDFPVATIYTMNVNEAGLEARNYPLVLGATESAIERTLGCKVRSLYATDTMQFDDYDKYEITAFDGKHKRQRRETEFPKDCEKARALGAALAKSRG
jgi:multimeric flavodoxin WrbA